MSKLSFQRVWILSFICSCRTRQPGACHQDYINKVCHGRYSYGSKGVECGCVGQHWTGSSGSERALHMHMHTCPFISCTLFTSSHGSMGVRCVLAACLVTNKTSYHQSVTCSSTQPHNHKTRMQSLNLSTNLRIQKLVTVIKTHYMSNSVSVFTH